MAIEILRDKVALCEGQSDEVLLQFFLVDLGLADDYQVIPYNGKHNFRDWFSIFIKLRNFDNLQTILIFQDADDDALGTVTTLQEVLASAGEETPHGHADITHGPRKIGLFIFPDGTHAGMMESLVLNAHSTRPEAPCRTAFLTCFGSLGKTYHNAVKSEFLLYLASHASIDWRQIIQSQEFERYSPSFEELKEFLRSG